MEFLKGILKFNHIPKELKLIAEEEYEKMLNPYNQTIYEEILDKIKRKPEQPLLKRIAQKVGWKKLEQ